MNRLLKIQPWQLCLILFAPFIIQVCTGMGLIVGDLVIGAFPAMIIYSIWMQLLLIEFEKKIGVQAAKVVGIRATKFLMMITIFVAIPLYWIVVNYMFNDSQSAIPAMLGIPFAFYFLYAAIKPWLVLSKLIYVLLNKSGYLVDFDAYKTIFFLFLLGPFTIWVLQPKIIKTLN